MKLRVKKTSIIWLTILVFMLHLLPMNTFAKTESPTALTVGDQWLNDWNYNETHSEIQLINYNGTNMDVTIYGEAKGKQVVLSPVYKVGGIESHPIKDRDFTSIKFTENNGKKVIFSDESKGRGEHFSQNRSLKSVDFTGLSTDGVTSFKSWFAASYNITSLIGMESLNTSSVTNMSSMFYSLTKITDYSFLTNWDTSSVTDVNYMFGYSKISDLTPLTNWNTSNITNMGMLFHESDVQDLTPLTNWNTSSVINMENMFTNTLISSIDPISNWDVSNVTSMRSLFSGTKITDFPPLINWNTSKVNNMSYMFYNTRISNIESIGNWNTSNVNNMSYMFSDTKLSDLSPITNWNTSSVNNMSYMFNGTLISDLSPIASWDTSNVNNMNSLFCGTQILDLSPIANWNTSNVTDMGSMFKHSKLNDMSPIANWDVSNVTNLNNIFEIRYSDLTVIDLSNWNINSSATCVNMFKSYYNNPLMVISNNQIFENYSFASNNRRYFKINYNANGGSFPNGATSVDIPIDKFLINNSLDATIDPIIQATQSKVESPAKEGFIFNGWSTTQNRSNGQAIKDKLSTTYYAKWKDVNAPNTPPTITANNIILNVGDKFDPLKGVSAHDAEEGDITNKVQVVSSNVDVLKVGEYQVNYSVTDSDGNTSTLTRIVTVKEKPAIPNTPPSITANNITLTLGDKFDPIANVSAHDAEDGDITDKIQVVSSNVNTSIAGTYEVKYSVVDSKGLETTLTIIVTIKGQIVIPNTPPTITANNITIKAGSNFDPLTGVTAYDAEDGDITNKIQVVSSTVDTSKPGTYIVKYQVFDSNLYISYKEITVKVLSNETPSITGSDINIFVGDKFNPLEGIAAYDAEDGDITDKIQVVSNNVNVLKAGEYQVNYSVTDSDGNTFTLTRIVTVNERPVIPNAPPSITASTITINLGDTFNPLNGVTAHDAEDGVITNKIQVVSNTVDILRPGIYKVIYSVADNNGNIASLERTVIVKEKPTPPPIDEDSDLNDKNPPSIIKPGNNNSTTTKPNNTNSSSKPSIEASDITITVGDKFDPLKLVSAYDKYGNNISDKVKVISNTVNTSIPGLYSIKYEIQDELGSISTKTINVTVNDADVKSTLSEARDAAEKTTPKVAIPILIGVASLAGFIYFIKK
ncbi:immunoglobulin-like domain-containing protein [Clostridium sp.]|uniref:immunoglobulin-like domain-containing protein n=1 Tax=Clostridium sp. TaxID=1506 RepID=UPI002FC77597